MSNEVERSPWMAVTGAEAELLTAATATAIALPSSVAITTDLPLGADTSFHQGLIDCEGAKEDGVIFLFIRWGQRDVWTDSQAKNTWPNAQLASILRGAYYVWDEREGADAEGHKEGVLAAAASIGLTEYDGELPLVADLELEPVDWSELRKWLNWLEVWTGRKPMIYTGSWFYARPSLQPLPAWLKEYDHWLTGYNDTGPSIWGPLAQLDPPVVCWQQANNWQVAWTGGLAAVDRNYWWAGARHLLEYADMAKKVVNVDELAAWIADNQYDAIPVPDGPPPDGPFRMQWPVAPPKVVTQWYGVNPQFYPGQKGHEGLDIRAVNGTPVMAMADGTVYRVEEDADSGPYGKQVRLEHVVSGDKYKTVYAHLMQVHVNVDDDVQTGQVLGLANNTGNSTGAHLHITLKKEGQGSDWLGIDDIVNPVPYMPDLYPFARIEGHSGQGWITNTGGNFRRTPKVDDNNLIYFIGTNQVLIPSGLFTGDWWEVQHGSEVGWFWNPGYKLGAF